MIPNALLQDSARWVRNDRASRELRAYARDEWHTDVEWIRSLSSGITLAERLRRWVRDRKRREPASPPQLAARAAETKGDGPPVPASAEPCPHPVLEELGTSGLVEFLRCSACGRVLVVHGDLRWIVGSSRSESEEELLEG